MTRSNSDDGMTKEERELLQEVVEEEARAVDQADEAVARVDADRTQREAEPYPPTTLKLDKPASPEDPPGEDLAVPQQDDEFALPSAAGASKSDEDATADTAEVTAEPYVGSIPSMVIAAELQKAMLRSRMIIQHTFEFLELEGNTNMLRYLQEEKPEAYADIVVRVAAMHFICWQKAMGL